MGITVIHHFSGRGDHRISFYPENPVLKTYFGGGGGLRTHPDKKSLMGINIGIPPKQQKKSPKKNG